MPGHSGTPVRRRSAGGEQDPGPARRSGFAGVHAVATAGVLLVCLAVLGVISPSVPDTLSERPLLGYVLPLTAGLLIAGHLLVREAGRRESLERAEGFRVRRTARGFRSSEGYGCEECVTVRQEITAVRQENSALRAENAVVRQENAAARHENSVLRRENEALSVESSLESAHRQALPARPPIVVLPSGDAGIVVLATDESDAAGRADAVNRADTDTDGGGRG